MALPQNLPRDADNTFVSETWAEAGVVVEPSAGRKATGWQPADAVTEGESNWLGREPARYARANQSQFPRSSSKLVSSWLDTGAGATAFGTWSDTGVGALEGFLSDATGIDARAVDVWLDPAGDGATGLQVKVAIGTPATFAATRDNYVFVPIDTLTGGLAVWADITLLAVGVGAPAPATPAGTIGVWVVETDGASIVGQTILVPTIPAFKTIGFEALNTIGTVMIGGDLDVAGSAEIGVDLEVIGETTVRMLTVADDAPAIFTGNVTLGTDGADAIVINGTTNVNATTTFNAAANFGGTTTTNGSLVANGNVSLGNNDGDAIDIGGGATDVVTVQAPAGFDENVTVAAGKKITTPELDTTDTDGIVRPGEVRFYSDATPSTATGVMQFAGRWVSIGLASAARKLSVPFEDWVAGPVATLNAIDDTGAQTVMTLLIGDTVLVEMTMESINTSAANNVNVQLEANAVVIGGTAPHRPVAASVYFTIRRVVMFTAPATNVYTFKARHGASAGTTTSTNIHILTRHAL